MEGKLNLRIFEIVLNALHLILQMQDMQENAGAKRELSDERKYIFLNTSWRSRTYEEVIVIRKVRPYKAEALWQKHQETVIYFVKCF